MAYYDLISENEESTVVAEFEKGFFAAEAPYMSESNLKDQFVALLGMQAYDFLPVVEINKSIKLSEHFTLGELTVTDVKTKDGNIPTFRREAEG